MAQTDQPLPVLSSEELGPRWWDCATHGRAQANAWGCPECVREMRAEITRLVRQTDDQRAKLFPLLVLLQEVMSIAAHGALLDGSEVNVPTLLWAEQWAKRLSGPNTQLKGGPGNGDGA